MQQLYFIECLFTSCFSRYMLILFRQNLRTIKLQEIYLRLQLLWEEQSYKRQITLTNRDQYKTRPGTLTRSIGQCFSLGMFITTRGGRGLKAFLVPATTNWNECNIPKIKYTKLLTEKAYFPSYRKRK